MRVFGVIVSGFAAYALLLVLLDNSILAQDAKDVKKTEEKKTEEKKAKLPNASEASRAKKMTVRIKEVKTEEPAEITVQLEDLSKGQEYRDWLKRQQDEIRNTKDPKARFEKTNHVKSIMLAERDKIMYVGQELQVPIDDLVRIRVDYPPKEYDESGKEKKLTSTQLAALKSPPLPGYKSSAANLRIGQVVELYLKPVPPAPRPAPTQVTKKGPIGADPKDAGPVTSPRTEVYIVLIKREPQ